MGCRESVVLPSIISCSKSGDGKATSASSASSAAEAARAPEADSSMIWITARQKQLIRGTWSTLAPRDSDYEHLGSEVFLRIFQRHPELLQLFPFGNVDSRQQHQQQTADQQSQSLLLIQSHPAFRNHMAAFVNAIGMAVDTLDDWDGLLTDTLLTLGAAHSTTRGFTVQNFEAFAESLIYVWKKHLTAYVDELQDPTAADRGNAKREFNGASLTEIIHAWEILFIFILMKLRDGYQLMRRLSDSATERGSLTSSQLAE
jgi:hemoglobin-like flavoprotein